MTYLSGLRPKSRMVRLVGRIMAAVAVFAIFATILSGWRDYREAQALRDHGVLAQGRFARTEIVRSSDSRRGSSLPRERHRRVWSYTAGGRTYEVGESGPSPAGGDTIPRLGPVAPGQVVYLPESPEVARLRTRVGPDLFLHFGIAGVFLFVGLLGAGMSAFAHKVPGGE